MPLKLNWKRAIGTILLCMTAAYVALLPQFYLVYQIGNRYTLAWSANFRDGILMAISILGMAYVAIYLGMCLGGRVLDRFQRRVSGNRIALDLSILGLWVLAVRSVMAIAYATQGTSAGVSQFVDSPYSKLMFYLVIPLAWRMFRRNGFKTTVLGLYRILTVLCILFLVQVFSWEKYTTNDTADKISDRSFEDNIPNSLYVFLFDGWSYDHTFGNTNFSLSNMPHLESLLRQSTLFRNAYSPGVLTSVSIPRFLFQTDKRIFQYSHNELEWGLQNRDFLPKNLHSVFDLSDQHFKHISGTYLFYPGFMGNSVDSIIPFYELATRYTVAERVEQYLFSQITFIRKLGLNLECPIQSFEWSGREYQARIRPVLGNILPRLPHRNISFFHMCVPHGPFVFNRDWSLREVPEDGWFTTNELSYLENVYAADAVIGDIVSILRERGDFDSSMIVILSDHSWKKSEEEFPSTLDPEPYISEKHVPLIIKYPRQIRSGEVNEPVFTAELHPLMNDYLNAPEKMAQWVDRWNSGDESNGLYSPE